MRFVGLLFVVFASCALDYPPSPTLVCPDSFDGRPVIVEVGEKVSLEPGLDDFRANNWTWALEFAPPESQLSVAPFQLRARVQPDVPGLYQLALTSDGVLTRRCVIRAVADGLLVIDEERSIASRDDIAIAGGVARFVFSSNEPLLDVAPELSASPPSVLTSEPRVFSDGERTVVEVDVDRGVRVGDIVQARLSATTALTETVVEVEHVVRISDSGDALGPRVRAASCVRNNGRAILMLDADDTVAVVELGGFSLGEHTLQTDGSALVLFEDNVPSGEHEVSIRGRSDTSIGPSLRFTCSL